MTMNYNDYVELRCSECGKPIGYIYKSSLTMHSQLGISTADEKAANAIAYCLKCLAQK